jgi:membrane protease YdiL (CAAX protease family)
LNGREVFYTTAGTLRAPWRLLLFVAAYVAALLIVQSLLALLITALFSASSPGTTASYFIQGAAALLATWFCLVAVEKKPWSDVGLHAKALQPRRLLLGLLVGGGAIAIAIGLLVVVGWLDRAPGTENDWGAALLRMALILLPAAFGEELITRGYVLTALKDSMGWRWAVILTSVAFGLLHLMNPGANAQSVIVVALAGVFLAAVRIVTDSLYAAWVAHFAWNWVMAAIFHVPVSGYAFGYPAYRYVDGGPDWATGGGWGPEIGVPACVMMVVGTAVLLRMSFRARARDLHLENRDG